MGAFLLDVDISHLLPLGVAGRTMSPTALREFMMRNPAVRAELASSGARGSHSGFGGGSSRGGGGRGGSW